MKPKAKLALKILYLILKIVVVIVVGFVLFYLYLFRLLGAAPNVYYSSFVLLVALGGLIIAWFLPFKKVRKVRKGFFFSSLAVLLAGIVAVGACLGYNARQSSITIKGDGAIDTSEYLAFHPESKIARLDHEASLRFTMEDDLPIVDGAAAFFPLYSSFVEATYPSDIPGLNEWSQDRQERGPYCYSNTIQGYYHLIEGYADILFAFGPDKNQLATAEHYNVEFELIPMGKEGFVFFTNKKNPVQGLTEAQLRAIYAGEIKNWKEVGGKKAKIEPFQRNDGSGSQTALRAFMGDVPLMTPPTELVNSFMWGIIEQVADYKNHRGAIGFSFHQYAEGIVANKNIRLLAVNGVQPTRKNIINGSYPIQMPFYMVVRKGERTEEMNRLIEWVLSEEGQSLVAASGYAPI